MGSCRRPGRKGARMTARCEACAMGRDAVALVGRATVDGLPAWPDRPVCVRCLAAAVVAAHRGGGGGLVVVAWCEGGEYVIGIERTQPAVPRAGALRLIRGGLAVAALLLLPGLAGAAVIVPPAGHCHCTLAELPRVPAVDPGY